MPNLLVKLFVFCLLHLEFLSAETAPVNNAFREAGKVDNFDAEVDTLDDIEYIDEVPNLEHIRSKKAPKLWDHWGKWSPCSVSCGVGKSTRWRHCVSEGCQPGEKEAQIKTCTMSPCPN